MKHHILVVEDDDKIRKFLQQYLKSQGYIVSSVASIAACEDIYLYFKFDLIILDIMLPDDTGFNFINRHRDNLDAPITDTPIIILSALGHVDDRVYGLESGARDYITKPFEPRELLLRIKNLISESNKPKITTFGNYKFDLDSRLLAREDQAIHLTPSERDLLHILCLNIKKIITRENLAMQFSDLSARSIDTMIARLRNKLEPDPKSPRYIITERNKGYCLWP